MGVYFCQECNSLKENDWFPSSEHHYGLVCPECMTEGYTMPVERSFSADQLATIKRMEDESDE